ncbi:MAG: M20/M25/M40 family metallo-hydrolase [Rikenellaceae bacterium]|nr:M20/M25/M40 family metallo-hydrolase [Rikenellaceae bacterium]
MINRILILVFFFSFSINLNAQNNTSQEKALKGALYFLASDRMQGRNAGDESESEILRFISEKLASYGYKPIFNNTSLMKFKLPDGRSAGRESKLELKNRTFCLDKDFFVPPFSKAATVTGKLSATPDSGVVLLLRSSEDSLKVNVAYYRDKGVVAVIYNSGQTLGSNKQIETTTTSIPVIQVIENTFRILAENNGETIRIKTDIIPLMRFSHNVFMGLQARFDKPYILIGAHYDHIGYGEGGSMKKGTHEVHNGADDNASGVSSMLEIARLLSEKIENSDYNIVVSAIGAEEKGLLGSAFLADTLKKLGATPSLMINLDMVGRLTENKLQVGGVGTFTHADSLLEMTNKEFGFSLVKTKDGYGPSDQSSFVHTGTPVLYFTSGVHKDYHTPEDDYEKINFEGLKRISDFIATLIENIVKSQLEIEYISIPPPVSNRTSFKVTLGLIPDFTYDNGDGFKIGPVTEGKPAHRAGMQQGDIITAINSKKVNNIYEYMSRLSELKSGDKVAVDIRRDGRELKLIIQL